MVPKLIVRSHVKRTLTQGWLRVLIVFALLGASALAHAEQANWAPIPAEEMALKDDPIAPGAVAVILFREQISDDKKGVSTEHIRIKVLKDAGKKYADIEIPTAKWMKIDSIEARTIRPDGSIVLFTGTIHDKTVAKTRKMEISVKAFTLPDVEGGSILEYKYRAHLEKERTPSHTWEVQSELFTRKAHFELRPISFDNISEIGLNFDQRPQRNGDTISLDVANVPAVEDETFTLPQSELGSRIEIAYRPPEYSTPETYWGRIGQAEGEYLNTFIGKDKQIKNLVVSLAPPSDPPETRLRRCYARTQQIRKLKSGFYDTSEGKQEKLKENKHVNDVLERGYGDIGDVTAVFVAMAREVGYQSGMAFLTDRKQGLFHPDLLSTTQLTATMAWVEKDGKFTLLDPACEKCPFGLISWDQSGASGVRTNYSGSVFVHVPDNKPEDASISRKGDLKLEADGTLSGKLNLTIGGLEALELRDEADKADEASRRKAITDLIKSWLPGSAEVKLEQVSDWDDIDKSIVAGASIKVPGFASVTGKRLFLPAGPFASSSQNPFPHARRKYAVVFENPYRRSDDLTIAVPSGYQVESLPEEKHSSDAIMDYSLKVGSEGDKIHVTRTLVHRATFVPVQYYKQVQDDFNRKKTSDEHSTILRQAVVASR